MALSREQLLARLDQRKYEEVEGVRIRSLTSNERVQFARARDNQNETRIDPVALLVVLAAVDENGNRLFPTLQDVDAVSAGDGALVDRIADAVMDLSAMSAQAVDDAGKNSEPTPSGDSSSNSAASSEPPPASSEHD